MFSIDPSRLSDIVSQSDASRLALSKAADALRAARAALRDVEANQAEYVRRGQTARAEELTPFVERAQTAFAAATAEHDRLQKLARTASGVARSCIDHAETAGIRC